VNWTRVEEAAEVIDEQITPEIVEVRKAPIAEVLDEVNRTRKSDLEIVEICVRGLRCEDVRRLASRLYREYQMV
jgi:hypothetical protein